MLRAALKNINYKLFAALLVFGFVLTIYTTVRVFLLYVTGTWAPTLTGIALLFGIGNAFDSVVSLVAYVIFLRKENLLQRAGNGGFR